MKSFLRCSNVCPRDDPSPATGQRTTAGRRPHRGGALTATAGNGGAAPDVVVVGAGVVGVSIAYALQARGARVLMLERAGVAEGQSGVQPGGVRLQWGTSVACGLALESLAWWRGAQDRLDPPVPLSFSSCGYLFLAHSDGVLARLTANVRVQNEAGVPSRIVDPTEAADLVPGLETASLKGAEWCAEDGYFDEPQAAIFAIARHLDVRIATVTGVEQAAGGWTVETSDGTIAASSVVLAAGSATCDLVRPLGVDLPIEDEPRHFFLSAPIRERLLEPLVISAERRFAAKQLHNGRVLASDLAAAGDPEQGAPAWRRNVREAIRELLPILEYADLDVIASGAYDVTPDRQPILGPLPGLDSLHVAAGFSGHGFMIAPAVGRILADAVMGAHDPVLDVLDWGRFADGRMVPEPQVI